MSPLIVLWGLAAGAAALYTGARQGFALCSMTGFLPPHYGYSAYAMVPLLFLGPRWARWAGAGALLLSGNRASWVGALAGWASAAGGRRLLVAAVLGLLAVVGGNALKSRGAVGDVVRIKIWKAAAKHAIERPGPFAIGVDGFLVTKAHSDVMQLAAEHGLLAAGVCVLAILGGIWALPASPEKSVVVALSVISVVDNRLHHPACAILYVAAWVAALRSGSRP